MLNLIELLRRETLKQDARAFNICPKKRKNAENCGHINFLFLCGGALPPQPPAGALPQTPLFFFVFVEEAGKVLEKLP